MATPVFKFIEPLSEQEYYFIYDTFYELPKTIPMCLSTFLYYHMESKRTLEGFLASFESIEMNGSSLFDATFEDFFNKEEKSFYLNQLSECYALGELLKLSKESLLVKEYLLNKNVSSKSLAEFIKNNLTETMKEFRPVNYYDSLSSTLPKIPYHKEIAGVSNGSDFDDDLPF